MRTYAVERYLETKSFNKTISDFVTKFNPPKRPYKSLIVLWVAKFRSEGTVRDLKAATPGRESHSGRKRKRSEEYVEALRESVAKSPHRPSRRRSQELGFARTTMLRAMKEDLNLFPYRISIHQKLTAVDKRKRLDMTKILADKIENTKSFLTNLWTSDEAHCYLEGQVNSKNNIFWGSEKPNEVVSKPLHSKKVTVWCAVSHRGIIGPFFFEENGVTTTINSDRYIVILEMFLEELKRLYPNTWTKMWFQQDGASPHAANKSLEWVKEHFKSRVISRKCEIEWPPYSPDLSPPDFFLWGYIKDKIYKNRPETLEDLKTNITDVIRGIKRPILRSVMQNFALRLGKVINQNGGHIEHML